MSTVDKMLIKGIRSFDPENKHVITFFKPLTLIVGSNGAGKTTVIECLKVACTGELPPNARSGQSFIHDPKVAGETETKAQIKLRFKTAAGKDVVCIRSFQLTQKASKMEYKAIESVLQTINPNTGEKVCLSYRCADMDREIPALMGVSKAILENVIFVHQDEANWPLQDSSTLKKKFDDIFSATRYTKALEVIKKLHKEQAQEIKTYKLKLEHLQTLKDSAYKLRESIAQDQERTEFLKVQMQNLDKEIEEVDAKIQCTEIKLKDLRKLQDQITEKSATRSASYKEQEQRYLALNEEIEETDEELKEWKEKFDEKISQQDRLIAKLVREGDDLEKTSNILSKKITEYLVEISKLQSAADAHTELKNDRDSMIKELYSMHNLGSLTNGPFSDETALSCTSYINERILDLEKDLNEKKKSNETEIKAALDSYNDANNSLKNLEAKRRANADYKNKILKRIKEKESERKTYEDQLSGFDLPRLDERERHTNLELERKTKQLAERDFDSIIMQKQSEIFNLNSKIKSLNRERDILAGDSENRVKLAMKKSEIENHKKKLNKIMDEHKDKIRGVLKGRLPPEKDLRCEILKAKSSTSSEFDDLIPKSREVENEVSLLQLKIKEVRNNLNKFQRDMNSRKKFIESKLQSLDQQLFGVDSYLLALNKAKEKRDALRSKCDMEEGMRKMFVPFEFTARNHHICPCCARPFSAEEEDEFVKKQKESMATTGERMKEVEAEAASADSIFQQLYSLRAAYDEYSKFKEEAIPQAEAELANLNEELDQKAQALDDISCIVAQVKADKDSVEALVSPVETVDRHFQEIQTLKSQVVTLEDMLDYRGLDIRSMEDIKSELNDLQNKKDKLQDDIEKLREEQKYLADDSNSTTLRLYSVREEKMKAVAVLNNFNKVEDELQSLMEEKSQVELEEKQHDEVINPLAKETLKLLSDYNALKKKTDCEYERQADLWRSQQQQLKDLLKLNSKIEEYDETKKAERLKELQVRKSQSESQLENSGQKKKKISDELESAREIKKNQELLRHNIDDNIIYREAKARVDELTRDLELLEQRLVEIGSAEIIESELFKLGKERDRLLSELNRFHGTMSVYESNISKNKIDLKQPQYKDIDKHHFDQLIQLKTTEMANKDLDRYYNALDKALMRFHTMKMEEINRIIREIWQQTYRGQDIDYIYIHSDSEGAGTRSYSYKVLMQTGDAELEMRGRCSAGQKVLASLIIRLALAETFCLHCGILALDEPTTNLDGPNSESLAAALLRIMEDRKGQENFQLIVITHDERFAQLIGQRQHAEKYYRVYKDEHQHSIISAQEIFD
ncbi:LOW QUALITY PROTEIN: DNA repair protein RAD50-like [Chenopodium quinoa]|uniref:LOW QUALITY PROTEIN: DNA repair protein RAD50-like n=1 Tax=Chenopodium quinoa TaxID=63459 RepID=UPI000B77297B|nr:LOW QUALITY PROTEIN: DNA repair protein RAD50-like [Chenopodium quinoa]